MKLVPLSEIFTIEYGHGLSLNGLTFDPQGIAFIGRSARNNGVTGRVQPIVDESPKQAGTLTVAVSGSVLETFLQLEPYYTAFHIFCLTERVAMTDAEKLYYCACIRANAYRYNYGRQANRTLKDLKVPAIDSIPSWVNDAHPDMFDGKDIPASVDPVSLPSIESWQAFRLKDLFTIKKGKRLTKADMISGNLPFIGAIDKNNGVRQFIAETNHIHEGGTITVNYNGSVAEAFYQPSPFHASDDVNVLYPNFDMTAETALFICVLLRQEKYRYNYGRKWHLERMEESVIRLPVDHEGNPDWQLMENYIKTLPYSNEI